MAAIGTAYATLVLLKERMKLNATTPSISDAALSASLTTASMTIEEMTGRQFNDSGGQSTRRFRPDSMMLTRVYDFRQDQPYTVTVNDALWQEGVHYELDPLDGIVGGQPGWPAHRINAIMGSTFYPVWPGKSNIYVTAQWGWAAVPVPIVEATLIAAEELAKLHDAPFGVGGYGQFGIIRVKQNPFVCRLVSNYILNPILAA